MDLIIFGAYVHSTSPIDWKLVPDGIIGIKDGVIEFIGMECDVNELPAAKRTIKLESTQFMVPGFVDTHIHAPQYPNAGVFGKSTLLNWLLEYTFPLESRFKDVTLARAVYTKVVNRGLKCGTTTAVYFGTVHEPASVELAKVCLEAGQRALVGRVCMHRFAPDSLIDEDNAQADIDFIKSVQNLDPAGHSIRPCITPRFAPSCTEETLNRLGKLAKKFDLPVQTHIDENTNEIEWVAELFPQAKSYADVYDRAGLLGRKTILAHAVHLKPEELNLIVERESGISHCPLSNSSIASGIAPIGHYLTVTNKIGLGTDMSGGSSMSVLENARHALLYSRLLSQQCKSVEAVLSVKEALYMATLGGARVADVDNLVGSFELGKRWDAQLIDVSSQDSPIDVFDFALPSDAISRLENLVNKWVYVGDDRNTIKVWVDGRLVEDKVV